MPLDEQTLRKLTELEDQCESISAGNPMFWDECRAVNTIRQQQDEIQQLRAEIERLREERRWIPVGERLPGSGRHLVTDGSIRWTAFWYDDCWAHNEPTHRRQPTHWMPLPAPPTEEE